MSDLIGFNNSVCLQSLLCNAVFMIGQQCTWTSRKVIAKSLWTPERLMQLQLRCPASWYSS